MKTILTTLIAAVMLLTALCGCARDMSGETRATPPAAQSSMPEGNGADTGALPGDSSKDGIIDEGRDAVDGVVGAGKKAVDDVVGAGEDVVDDVTGHTPAASKSTPKATEKP